MSWMNDCPSVFRCNSVNRPRQWIVPEEEVGRRIDYRNVREMFKYTHPHEWSPLVQSYLSDENLANLSRELQRRLKRATNANVFIELDQDRFLYETIIEIMHRNTGAPWTTQSIRCLNEAFLKQATHDIAYGLRNLGRYERQINLKQGRHLNVWRPLYRNKKKNDIDMNPSYYHLTHPDAKANDELHAFQQEQLCRERPHGVLVHRPFHWT